MNQQIKYKQNLLNKCLLLGALFSSTMSFAQMMDEQINKQDYLRAEQNTEHEKMINPVRANMLRETALSLGARGGLAERAYEINQMLLHNEWVLYRIFNFNGMLLPDNVLPPVLAKGKNPLTLAANDVIRVADEQYEIVSQARFITAAPTWRDYLWMSYSKPEIPDKSLLPRNKYERQLWKKDLAEGWDAGRDQADVIYTENLSKLTRDMNGMILYRTLLAKNMVTPPYVSKLNMGITGDNKDMSINDRILRITAFPQFQHDGNNWKTDIYLHE